MIYIYFTTKGFEARYLLMSIDVYDIHCYWMFMVEIALIVYGDSDIVLRRGIDSEVFFYSDWVTIWFGVLIVYKH
ncbi:hypothetical protein BDB01DRAFT_815638 [Pilobolus umbonatus]|nr:hypothetical protein BDB01DRAFT_815638 [Pilobolus umbonatus]